MEQQVLHSQPKPEQRVSKHLIDPDLKQPRKYFNEERLLGLRDSIITIGQQTPIAVFEKPDGRYQIVVGERRWRAFMMIESSVFDEMRAFVVPPDTDARLWQVAENIQREPLNPIEEAQGYDELLKEKGLSQAKLSQAVGKSEIYISRSLMLLKLPESVQELVAQGSLALKAARMLIMRCDSQKKMAAAIVDLSKQHQGIKKITSSSIARYLDEQHAPQHLHPRVKREKQTLVLMDDAEQTGGSERVSEASLVQRLMSDLVGAGDQLQEFVRSDQFVRLWRGMAESDQKELFHALVRLSRLSQELQKRVLGTVGNA